MVETQGIVGIYTYINNSVLVGGNTNSSYYLSYLFSDSGLIDREYLQDLYGQTYTLAEIHRHDNYIGPFDDLDALNKFSFKVCDELRADRIVLHTLEEYNSIMESVHSVSNLKERLITDGNVIENLEVKNKISLFDKFFNKM